MRSSEAIALSYEPVDPSSTRRLAYVLALVLLLSFAALLYFGREIYQQAPPIPKQVVTMMFC